MPQTLDHIAQTSSYLPRIPLLKQRATRFRKFLEYGKAKSGEMRRWHQALRHYRYEVEGAKSDPAGGHISLSKVPRHDWASHGADAFRTAAVMIREPERKKEQEKRRPGSRLSPRS